MKIPHSLHLPTPSNTAMSCRGGLHCPPWSRQLLLTYLFPQWAPSCSSPQPTPHRGEWCVACAARASNPQNINGFGAWHSWWDVSWESQIYSLSPCLCCTVLLSLWGTELSLHIVWLLAWRLPCPGVHPIRRIKAVFPNLFYPCPTFFIPKISRPTNIQINIIKTSK